MHGDELDLEVLLAGLRPELGAGPLPDDLARLGLKHESGNFLGGKGKPDRSIFLIYYARAKV